MLSGLRSFRKFVPVKLVAGARFQNKFTKNINRSLSTYDPSKVRNVAIIAHVDHGKDIVHWFAVLSSVLMLFLSFILQAKRL